MQISLVNSQPLCQLSYEANLYPNKNRLRDLLILCRRLLGFYIYLFCVFHINRAVVSPAFSVPDLPCYQNMYPWGESLNLRARMPNRAYVLHTLWYSRYSAFAILSVAFVFYILSYHSCNHRGREAPHSNPLAGPSRTGHRPQAITHWFY